MSTLAVKKTGHQIVKLDMLIDGQKIIKIDKVSPDNKGYSRLYLEDGSIRDNSWIYETLYKN